ncbi:MAG TPA: division/cell wall cluster transcriptional repressor MraZ [Firmicutes bacterium]|jgi:MraZ protein|nr:division/cell wall cluster transcriptional repressor MraZ [Bacillota bacterium]
MFMGEFTHNIDEKGRLIVPAKFRAGLGDSFMITRGLDDCLFVYPHAEWSMIEAKLKALPFTRADARAFVRFFFSGASECEVDKQGRILVPPGLRRYAGLEREVVVIGVSNRVEIWSADNWQEYSAKAELTYEEAAEKLEDLHLDL